MSGKIYRHNSMHVLRSTIPLTNQSWQVWRSIYNSHIVVKISPTKIWVYREQATLINVQGHLYKGTRQNMHVTKHNNADQTFWIFYFLCVFGFVGANWSHRYYSCGKGLGLWPNIQSEDKSVFEDDQQRKKWKLFYRKR